MRRIAYLSNIFVRNEDFFVACFGLWIDSFCFWAVRPMKAIKNSTPFFAVFIVFRYMPYKALRYSLGYLWLLTLYPNNMKYSTAFNCPSGPP